MQKKRVYVCSVEAAMDVIGGKWKPHILLKIKDSPLRFGAIQEKLPAISQKMLTASTGPSKQIAWSPARSIPACLPALNVP